MLKLRSKEWKKFKKAEHSCTGTEAVHGRVFQTEEIVCKHSVLKREWQNPEEG